jgi:hypothetical protein
MSIARQLKLKLTRSSRNWYLNLRRAYFETGSDMRQITSNGIKFRPYALNRSLGRRLLGLCVVYILFS